MLPSADAVTERLLGELDVYPLPSIPSPAPGATFSAAGGNRTETNARGEEGSTEGGFGDGAGDGGSSEDGSDVSASVSASPPRCDGKPRFLLPPRIRFFLYFLVLCSSAFLFFYTLSDQLPVAVGFLAAAVFFFFFVSNSRCRDDCDVPRAYSSPLLKMPPFASALSFFLRLTSYVVPFLSFFSSDRAGRLSLRVRREN